MSAQTPSYFKQRIDECRAAFDKDGAGILAFFGLGGRSTHDSSESITESLRPHYRILSKTGRIVWGSIAQVNSGMFAAGPVDLPGVTVYSTDPHYDAEPQDLFAVGRACFRFKGTEPANADFRPVAARLTDESDTTVRMLLPRQLTDDRGVFLGATMFHRARLPGRTLRGSLFPMVVAPEATEVNMVLPLRYWSRTLCDEWATLRDRLESAPTASTALEVAESAEKGPARRLPRGWDENASPIYVTPAMVRAFASIVKQSKVAFQPYLFIGLRANGTKYAEFINKVDRPAERSFASNGIKVVIRKNQLDQLRGTIVDYQDTVFAKGIVIRLPDE